MADYNSINLGKNFKMDYGFGGGSGGAMSNFSGIDLGTPYKADYGFGGVSTAAAGGAAAAGANSFTGMQKWFGGTNAAGASTMGYAPAALSGASLLLNGFMGMKQYGLAKKQFKFAKESFNKNFALQKQTLNSRMEGLADARASADPTAASGAQYMAKYGLK